MEEHVYSEFPNLPKRQRRCCGHGTWMALLGLVTVMLWAGLLLLLLFWHWDAVQKLKQLEQTTAQNVSQVSKDVERQRGDQMAQKSQAAQVSQNMEKIQAEQKRMKAQDSELSRNLDGLRSDLSNLKSQSLNERRTALHSLERLQEEVEKLWIELQVSNARIPRVTPGQTLPPTLPIVPTGPAMGPATAPATVLAMASATVPATAPATASATAPATVPATASAKVPATAPATASATASATVPATASTTVPVTAPSTAPTTTAPLSLSSTPGSTCNTCPEKWVNFQRKCYYFGEGAKKWIQARFACSKLQGRLVSIHSQEEQDFLAKHANRKGTWIGLRDLDIEGEFIWMDKNPLNYSNWRPGEPNNQGQGEDCVMMQGSGQWNDAFCGSRLDGWVCDRLATC
ncbi:low affinity immunoglobulin epsilon Fc receptor isoform X1 [Hyaena hyaena]|uniref:low affinity immunoglobulin epsilon Fc receptor isoform X1 n=1 Tax=Hyaena hyaena TaxID=95912 RepID=UPI001924633F|nr:low affinity immunoglobulin epsilon Fc receptor isoform X1 [Hyaena hyaena]XP_039107541.1 low affinity immunoglobulin epsilon Fc receptor isoform X1 [Hyaena hyaena]XP_039107542.1 low affinity immunoglobulin epsilon Fc receptor isoform X1 [Hyaena hyaena]